METKQLHPMVAQLEGEVDFEMANEKSSAPPVELYLDREPVLSAPEDKAADKSIKIAAPDDDWLPYLSDLEDSYDLQEQAYQTKVDGVKPVPGTVSNRYLKPLKKTVMGIDVATGERVLNRGDFNNEEAARNYRQGAAKFKEASLNVNDGYDVNGISGAAHMAAGVIAEGNTKKEYMRSIDMMNVPEWQANAGWNAAVSARGANNINDAFSEPYTAEELQGIPDEPLADMSRDEMTQDKGWIDSTSAIYEAEEGRKFEGDPSQLMDWFVDEMSNFNWKVTDYGFIPGVNTSSMSYYAWQAHTKGGEYAKNFLAMMDNYDRLDTDWGVVGNTLSALAGDPTSLIGLGGGAVANKAMGRVAKNRLKAWMQYAITGAAAGTLEGAIYGGADSAMRQSVAVDAGAQESIDMGNVALNAAAGAVVGQGIGGLMGAALSPEAISMYRRGGRQMMSNARRGGSHTPITMQRGSIGFPKEEPYPVPPEIMSGPTLENAFEMAASGTFANKVELKYALQGMARSAMKKAGVNLKESNPKNDDILAGLFLADAKKALVSNSNAIGWYDRTVGRAMDVMEQMHPELATDPDAATAFKYILAVTSNGMKVGRNFELAEKSYQLYKETGKFAENIGEGKQGGAMNVHAKMFNDMKDAVGVEGIRDLFDTKMTVGQLKKLGYPVSGYVDDEVYGSMVIGPKIGNGFYSNLNGRFDQLTMDLWLRRTLGRLTGDLIQDRPEMVAKKRTQLKSFVAELRKNEPALLKQIESVTGKIKTNTNANIDASAKLIAKATQDPANRTLMNQSSTGENFRKAGNGLFGWIDKELDAPTEFERRRTKIAMEKVLAELNKDYPDMTMADLQALLWYPEKRLYDKAKSSGTVSEGYEDDDAPDYANAAVALAKSKGIDPAKIKEAISNGDNARRLRSGSGNEEASTGQGSTQEAVEGSAQGQAETKVVLDLSEKLNLSRDAELVKKGEVLVASKFLDALGGDSAVLGHPGSSVQETYINNTLEPLLAPYRDYMDAKDITQSEFIDEIMAELSDNLGGKENAEKVVDVALSLMEPPGGSPR